MVSSNTCITILFFSTMAIYFAAAGHRHVYHRIHVPTKVKTFYHTKIIKVPQHHHYIKEKEKIVKVPEHHHYFHDKEKDKDLSEVKTDSHDFGGYDDHHSFDWGASEHDIFKKHAPHSLYKPKKRNVRKYRKSDILL